MKTKLIYALSALVMIAAMLATSCSKDGDDTTPKPPKKERIYTVDFDANGGTGTMTAQSIKEDKSTALDENIFTYTDHTFSGWNTAANGTGTSYADKASVTIAADLTLYAQWIANTATTYEVTFNANGGDGGTMTAQVVEEDIETTLSANEFTHTNHTFSGWNTAEDGTGTPYADGGKVTLSANLTLYAQWIADVVTTYEVTFNANGGDGGVMTAQVVEEDTETALNANTFTRTGDYVFSGWNTAADGDGTPYADKAKVTLMANLTLYAQWKKVFTVTFLANGGEGTMAVQVVEGTRTVKVNKNTFTHSNSTLSFFKWNGEPDGSGSPNCVDEGDLYVYRNMTLYAIWLKKNPGGLFLAYIDDYHVPEGDTWTIEDTDATAGDRNKFEGLRYVFRSYQHDSYEIKFPNLTTFPEEALIEYDTYGPDISISSESVTTIKKSAFESSIIGSIELPKATIIGESAFKNIRGLKTLVIAKNDRIENATTDLFSGVDCSQIDLTTHVSNVNGKYLVLADGTTKVGPFKSVITGFPDDAIRAALYIKPTAPGELVVNQPVWSAIPLDIDSRKYELEYDAETIEKLENTTFLIGYDRTAVTGQTLKYKYKIFGNVTWTSSEEGDESPYLGFTCNENGSIDLNMLRDLPTIQKTVIFTATATNGEKMSFDIILKGKSTIIIPGGKK